jgi:hypothetical protein
MQKLKINIMDNITVEFESADVADIIKRAAFWSELPKVCPLCQAPIVFFYRNPKDNDYYGLHCTGPRPHETNFGQYKLTEKGFYYKGTSSWTESVVKWDTPGEQTGQPANGSSSGNGNFPETPRPESITEPVARNLGDLVTAKQLGMIRALAREARVHEDEECNRVMKCRSDELSKTAASSFIKHLQEMGASALQRTVPERNPPAPAPSPAQLNTAATVDVPGKHPASCLCPACDTIPF